MITLGHSATPYHSTVDLRAKNHKQQVPIYCNFRWNSLHYNPTCHCPFSYPVVPPCSVRILAPSGHTALRMLPHQTESRPPILGKSPHTPCFFRIPGSSENCPIHGSSCWGLNRGKMENTFKAIYGKSICIGLSLFLNKLYISYLWRKFMFNSWGKCFVMFQFFCIHVEKANIQIWNWL